MNIQPGQDNPKNKTIVFQNPPQDFCAKFEIVSCHIEKDDKLLFLKRAKNKLQPNTWGVPGGKKDNNETDQEAIIREVFEETNISIQKKYLSYFKKVYIRYPDYDFIYHIFIYKLPNQSVNITLNPNEHNSCRWVSVKDAISKKLPLILGEETCLRLIYNQ